MMLRTTNEIVNYIKNSWLLLLLVFLFFYFSYHLVSGDRGVIKMLYLKNQIEGAKEVLFQKQTERQKIEENVKRLSSASLDLDLLDERARVVLNMAGRDEFIILDEQN